MVYTKELLRFPIFSGINSFVLMCFTSVYTLNYTVTDLVKKVLKTEEKSRQEKATDVLFDLVIFVNERW